MITTETRRESYDKIQPSRNMRYQQCIDALSCLKNATANDIANFLFTHHKTPTFNRNYVHPRLNELMHMGIVQVTGKRKDEYSDRNCAIYELKCLS
jgi:hypothetical protein